VEEGLLVDNMGSSSIVGDHDGSRRVEGAVVVDIGSILGFSPCAFRFWHDLFFAFRNEVCL